MATRRISLPALAVILCVAGLFLAANLVKSGPLLAQTAGSPEDGYGFDYWWGVYRGWPLQFQEVEVHQVKPYYQDAFMERGEPSPYDTPMLDGRRLRFEELRWARYIPFTNPLLRVGVPLALNLVTALVCIAGAGAVAELAARRIQGRPSGRGGAG